MPKKSRRSKAKKRAKLAQIARERSSQQAAPAVVAPAAVAPAAAPAVLPRKKTSEAQDFAIRYQYVMPELRRIGILTGIILLILLVLSFIIG